MGGLYDLADDYFAQFVPRVASVTAEEVTRVVARHLDPAHLTTLIVGDLDVIGGDLAQLDLGEPVVISSLVPLVAMDAAQVTSVRQFECDFLRQRHGSSAGLQVWHDPPHLFKSDWINRRAGVLSLRWRHVTGVERGAQSLRCDLRSLPNVRFMIAGNRVNDESAEAEVTPIVREALSIVVRTDE